MTGSPAAIAVSRAAVLSPSPAKVHATDLIKLKSSQMKSNRNRSLNEFSE